MIDIYNLPDDKKTWDLLATGKTAGIFQLDNEALGGRFCKKVEPKSIEDLANVISIIRPGTLSALLSDGESAAVHFERRHRGVEEDGSLHPELDKILGETHQIILYQEQIMTIVQKLAGFDGPQSMRLLKGIGKKKADVLFALEEEFVAGCKTNNIKEEDSRYIFSIIKESARYCFNLCVHKNTRLKTKHGPSDTVEEMYGGEYGGQYCEAMSLSGSEIITNNIESITYQGKQQTYKVSVGESSICVTINHKFPTTIGELPLSEIIEIRKDRSLEQPRLFLCIGEVTAREISGIEPHETTYVYDITMSAPHHNFVVDSGIVTSNSHAVGYAKRSYVDAYIKANHMTEFYIAALRLVKDKINHKEKTKQLIKEAETFGIQIYPPRLKHCYAEFAGKDKKIWCGVSNIKGIGLAQAELIVQVSRANPKNWYTCLMMLLPIKKTTVENCLKVGFFKDFGGEVREQLDQYRSLLLLTNKEKELVQENYSRFTNLIDLLTWLKTKAAKRRVDKVDSIIKMLQNPAERLKDLDRDIPKNEEDLLNCAVSYNNIDTVVSSFGNCTVEEFKNKKFLKEYKIVCEVEDVRLHEIGKGVSKGRTMAFTKVFDNTGKMDIVLFDEAYEDFGSFLIPGQTLTIKGYRSKKGSLTVNEIQYAK